MHFKLLAAVAASALIGAPAYATTSLAGSVGIGVHASVGADDQSATDSAAAVAPTSETLAAAATTSTLAGDVTAYGSVDATWLSADAGTVDFTWGWDIQAPAGVMLAETNTVTPNWSYTFVASGNGRFFGTYDVVGSGDTFGLQPLYGVDDLPFGPMGGGINDPTGSGTFSVDLVSGQTYTMSVRNFGNLTNGGGLTAVGSAAAQFDWNIDYQSAAVPEPATWALMIGGFGLAGGMLRRRRVATPA